MGRAESAALSPGGRRRRTGGHALQCLSAPHLAAHGGLGLLSRNDAVELRFDSENESTERWSELTSTRYGPVALTFSGLGSSRSTSIASIRLSGRVLEHFFRRKRLGPPMRSVRAGSVHVFAAIHRVRRRSRE